MPDRNMCSAGEGLVDLYAALQPLVDSLIHTRRADRAREEAAHTPPEASDEELQELGREAGMLAEDEAQEEAVAAAADPGPIKLAIVGVPNVVRPP